MRKILKLIILPPLHLIRFIIKNIIEVVVKHAIPNYDLPILPLSKSINDLITPTPFNSPTPTASSNRKLKKVLTFSIHNIDENVKKTHDYFEEDEYKDCYNHFKKYFYTSLLVQDRFDALRYALERSLSNHKKNDLYLEFGVFVGNSTNFISKILKDIPLYGFDSFEGLREDWYATASPKGRFNKYKKVPKLNKNVIPIIGWVQDTLPDFLTKNKRRGVNFVYLDLDTYPSTKFVLEKIKPYLNDKCIIVFDQLYNYPGWRIGEYKALIETFSENEFKYLCFAKEAMGAVVIEFNNKSNLN